MACKILVVDSEPRILRFLCLRLRGSGYEVISSTRGDEAIELARSARPDMVLLAMIMPGMDGFEVLQKIRYFSSVPIIAMSRVLENADKAMSLGANGFVAKPFDLDSLVSRIVSLLETGPEK